MFTELQLRDVGARGALTRALQTHVHVLAAPRTPGRQDFRVSARDIFRVIAGLGRELGLGVRVGGRVRVRVRVRESGEAKLRFRVRIKLRYGSS